VRREGGEEGTQPSSTSSQVSWPQEEKKEKIENEEKDTTVVLSVDG
jgi:hypothetical protein